MKMAAIVERPHDIVLPQIGKNVPSVSTKEIESPKEVAQTWLCAFESSLASGDTSNVTSLIHEDGWWRDHLALSWDFHTLRGLTNIKQFLEPVLSKARFHNLRIQESGKFAPNKQEPIQDLEWVESMFSFDTAVGSGKGIIRLVCMPNGTWKAHMVYTALQQLQVSKEMAGEFRPHGGNNSLKGGAIEGNWEERRQRQKEFVDEEPESTHCWSRTIWSQLGCSGSKHWACLVSSSTRTSASETTGDIATGH